MLKTICTDYQENQNCKEHFNQPEDTQVMETIQPTTCNTIENRRFSQDSNGNGVSDDLYVCNNDIEEFLYFFFL